MVSTVDSKSMGLCSSQSGATNIKYMGSVVKSLKERLETLLITIEVLDREVRSLKLENNQWFIDWQDELNRISVK